MAQVEELVRKILEEMNSKPSSTPTSTTSTATVADYPISKKHPEWIKLGNGKGFEEITLQNILDDKVTAQDMRITPEILRKQGEIAQAAGRSFVKNNFDRAAELTKVPDARLLEMYNALRPYRSTKQELLDIATELETQYNATISAGFFREAAEHYTRRKKLKGDN